MPNKKVLIILGLILLVATVVIYANKKEGKAENEPKVALNLPKEMNILPTKEEEIPFYELTIPYLRNREYKSSLGELKKSYENAGYTAYITSYDSDGLRIEGLLTQPKGDKPETGWSGIIFIHGYIPPQQYSTTQNYYDYVDYLAKNGFVVFKIDLRGHGNSQGEAGGAYYSSDYVIDTLNAYAALQSTEFVDANKIGLWGHSMAGNVVMRSIAAKPDIKAVSIWAGAVYTYTDFSEYSINDNSYQPPSQDSERVKKRQQLFDTHGSFTPENEFWKQVPPANYLSDLKGAVQLNHALNDNVVSIEYSRNLKALLDNAGVENELNEYSSGGHNINNPSFNQAMQDTVEFFKKYLK